MTTKTTVCRTTAALCFKVSTAVARHVEQMPARARRTGWVRTEGIGRYGGGMLGAHWARHGLTLGTRGACTTTARRTAPDAQLAGANHTKCCLSNGEFLCHSHWKGAPWPGKTSTDDGGVGLRPSLKHVRRPATMFTEDRLGLMKHIRRFVSIYIDDCIGLMHHI